MTLTGAILSTLSYHDIFDYPLTADEIHKYLIGKKANLAEIQKELAKLVNTPGVRKGQFRQGQDLFTVSPGKKLFQTRKIRQKYSQRKFKRAQLFSFLLSLIPTVKLIAITGALAMGNSHKNDDIDLLIITAKGTLWTTRFLANLILLPFKRSPRTKLTSNLLTLNSINNRACLNIFLDESDLTIKEQNLYTAHEIAQLKPIWDKNETYSRLIKRNIWVNKFLPNWQPTSSVIPAFTLTKEGKAGIQRKGKPSTVYGRPSTIEIFLKKFQIWYMRSKVSTEKIGRSQLFFHPSDTQDLVLKEYQKRLRRLKISSN